eukprot:6272838-Amphidinium_carterae.1
MILNDNCSLHAVVAGEPPELLNCLLTKKSLPTQEQSCSCSSIHHYACEYLSDAFHCTPSPEAKNYICKLLAEGLPEGVGLGSTAPGSLYQHPNGWKRGCTNNALGSLIQ